MEAQLSFIKGPALPDGLGDRLYFAPAGDLLEKGAKATITEDDVWRLDEENTSEAIWDKLMPLWEEEQKRPKYAHPAQFSSVQC